MTGSAQWDFQVAVFKLFTNDGILKGLLTGGLFDGSVPQDVKAKLPYGVVGECNEIPADRLAFVGMENYLTIHLFSEYRGQKEVKTIASRMIALLHHKKDLELEDWVVNHLQLESSFTQNDPDEIRHLILRFVAQLQPKVTP